MDARRLDEITNGIRKGKENPDGDDDYDRPDVASGEYRPSGHPRTGKTLNALHIYFNAAGRAQYKFAKKQFQYNSLESDSEDCGLSADGTQFTVLFTGSKKSQMVTVSGRNLEPIYDYISFHKIPWIRAADRDFAADGEPIITSIDIKQIEAEG